MPERPSRLRCFVRVIRSGQRKAVSLARGLLQRRLNNLGQDPAVLADFSFTNEPLHELLDGGHVDPLEAWHLYLNKAANDVLRSRQRTPPTKWFATFERRMDAYRDQWESELSDYISVDFPTFGDVERRSGRYLAPVLAEARDLAE